VGSQLKIAATPLASVKLSFIQKSKKQLSLCDMTPESCNRAARGAVHCRFHRNEHACNNKRSTVSMQWQSKHTSITTEDLLGNGVFCWDHPEAI
jgi:hypothetical protein